ncbi:MAG: uracil-DNA glycosylase family protein [Candidatus Micrarchaeia archaeon]
MIKERSAGAVVYYRKNKEILILLLKGDNRYDMPKGHLENDEDDLSAAKREIFEETSLKPKILEHFSMKIEYQFRSNKLVEKSVVYFIGKSSTQNVKVSKEHKGYEWLEIESALEKIAYDNLKHVISKAYEYILKYEKIHDLNKEYAKLPYINKNWDLSKKYVKGYGPLNTDVMIVGQAPGRLEDEKLLPFIGRSGVLLNSKIERLGISRDSCYITSAVQFFPPKNRIPTDKEIYICKNFLIKQIEIIKPKFIITLGSISTKVLLNIDKVSKHHGELIKINNIQYMITFHPAAALRFKRISKIMDNDFDLFKKYINK